MSRLKQLSQCLEEKYFLSEQDGEKFVANLFEIIRERLLVDKIVKVKGLGTFKLAEMNARESVNVNTGERITIEGRYKLTFTPENAVRDRINSPFASFESIDMDNEIDFSAIDEKYESGQVEEPAVEEPAVEEPSVVAPVVEPVVVEHLATVEVEESVQPAEEPIVAEAKPMVELVAEEPSAEVPVEEESSVAEEPVVIEEPDVTEEPAAELVTAEEETVEEETVEPQQHTEQETNTVTAAVRAPICEELIRKDMNHNQTIITLLRWVLALIILLLLCLGGYVLYNVGREKGAMEMEYYIHQHSVESEDARMAERAAMAMVDESEDSAEAARPKHDISLIKTPKPAETKPAVKEKPAPKPAATPEVKKPAPAQTQPAKPVAQPAKPTAQPAKSNAGAYDAYNNKDARVRTGAYNIVGLQETVTVREGQTLKSISKFYLGDGMECYIEAFNGGKTSFAAGEKVRIPKLELKKKSQK